MAGATGAEQETARCVFARMALPHPAPSLRLGISRRPVRCSKTPRMAVWLM